MGNNKQITLCTVHFNTPKLMDALVKSIRMHVSDFHLYVFDNSDKYPYYSNDKDITIIDNTKGQIINFSEWLEKYPDRLKSYGNKNGYVSAKHCYTIQKCIELIDKNFMLLDSDILLKQDITPLFDERYVYVGESQKQNGVQINRVLPFLCFINVNECKRMGITYFSAQYMHGLHPKNQYDLYDTGAYFHLVTRGLNFREIKLDDYIVHYKGGSWSQQEQLTNGMKISSDEWLRINKKLWSNPNTKVIYTCITGNYDTLKNVKREDGWDYICFTDKDVKSDTWEIRPLPNTIFMLNDVKKQRYVKLNPHLLLSEYDLSIWMDGNLSIKENIGDFISDLPLHDTIKTVFFKKHPQRDCLYSELDACSKLKKETKENIKRLKEYYDNEHFPQKQGLYETNVIIRKHNEPSCINLMNTWTKELLEKSHRDQLSLTYCIWKLGCQDIIYDFDNTVFSQYFTKVKHLIKKQYNNIGGKETAVQEKPENVADSAESIYNDAKQEDTKTAQHIPTPKVHVIKQKPSSVYKSDIRKRKIKRW